LLAEIGRERLSRLGARRAILWDRAVMALLDVLQSRAGQDEAVTSGIDRVQAGSALGLLGDPRIPVTIAEWEHEISRALAGDNTGYFCLVEAGMYIIGSANDDLHAQQAEKSQHTITFKEPFWIARYPITNAQRNEWVVRGGRPTVVMDDARFTGANQPVVAIRWFEARDFCRWLQSQLVSVLPPNTMICLPTEQEWEAAARGSDGRHYPWGDDWQTTYAATAEDRAVRGDLATAPVGCYPSGASQCGALDMAGNVWEWTASDWRSYPGAQQTFSVGKFRVLRGGSWLNDSTGVRCGVRERGLLIHWSDSYGFRVVMSPRSY
jgi:formylglycine-generating enzyme required for sulfatase activity